MIEARPRAFLSERQGLNHFETQPSATILASRGWARTVGGANPYLTLFARNQATRQEIDSNVAKLEIHEFASARGCTYLLPAEHFQIGIKCGQGFNADSAIRTAKSKLGVTDKEIYALKERILAALQSGPLGASDFKSALGNLYQNFGEAGKKIGQTSNVSLGLLALQAEAKIRRIPSDGRLDGQSYSYCLFENAPIVDDSFPQAEAFKELAALFWQWCGFASMAHFQWFSGLGVKAAQAAVEHLGLVRLDDTSLFGLPRTIDEYREFSEPEQPVFRLVSGLDSLFLLRRDLSLHLDATEQGLDVLSQGKLSKLGALNDLSTHAIADRGRIVGLWEYDFDGREIVWVSFVGKPPALLAEIDRVQAFIQEELIDARSFSLDSPKSRQASLARLRELSQSASGDLR